MIRPVLVYPADSLNCRSSYFMNISHENWIQAVHHQIEAEKAWFQMMVANLIENFCVCPEIWKTSYGLPIETLNCVSPTLPTDKLDSNTDSKSDYKNLNPNRIIVWNKFIPLIPIDDPNKKVGNYTKEERLQRIAYYKRKLAKRREKIPLSRDFVGRW